MLSDNQPEQQTQQQPEQEPEQQPEQQPEHQAQQQSEKPQQPEQIASKQPVQTMGFNPTLKHSHLTKTFQKKGNLSSPTDSMFSPMTKKIEAKRNHLLKRFFIGFNLV
jgi:outer membrane biosynthesis protein TonB